MPTSTIVSSGLAAGNCGECPHFCVLVYFPEASVISRTRSLKLAFAWPAIAPSGGGMVRGPAATKFLRTSRKARLPSRRMSKAFGGFGWADPAPAYGTRRKIRISEMATEPPPGLISQSR
jgi:hypothetical protein